MKRLQTLWRARGIFLLLSAGAAVVLAVTVGMWAARGQEPTSLRTLSGDPAALNGFAFTVELFDADYDHNNVETVTVEGGAVSRTTDWDGYTLEDNRYDFSRYTSAVVPVTRANGKTSVWQMILDCSYETVRQPDGVALLRVSIEERKKSYSLLGRMRGTNTVSYSGGSTLATYTTALRLGKMWEFPYISYGYTDDVLAVTDSGTVFFTPTLDLRDDDNQPLAISGRAPILRLDSMGAAGDAEQDEYGVLTEIASYDTLDGARTLVELIALGEDILLVTQRLGALDLYRFAADGTPRGELTLPYEATYTYKGSTYPNSPYITVTRDEGRYVLHVFRNVANGQTSNGTALTEVLAPDGGGLTAGHTLTDADGLHYTCLRHGDRLLLFAGERSVAYGDPTADPDDWYTSIQTYGDTGYPRPYMHAQTGLRLTVLDLSDAAPETLYAGVLDLPAAADQVQRWYAPFPANDRFPSYAEGGCTIGEITEKEA